MAKEKEVQKTDEELMQELMAQLSPEEQEALKRLTGQDTQGGGGGPRLPKIKINYNDDEAEIGGKVIAKGNFVIGQTTKPGTDSKGKPIDILVEAGTDLGKELKCILLKIGSQYSFASKDAKQRCSSQVCTERDEVPVGSKLKKVCNDGSCPRRQEGLGKDDKCGHQYLAWVRLPKGTLLPDGTEVPVALFYVKGTSYRPFKEYLRDGLAGAPMLAVTTAMTTGREKNGAVTYYPLILTKGATVPVEIFKDNFGLVRQIDKDLQEFKVNNAKSPKKDTEQKQDEPAKEPAGGSAGVSGGAPAEDDSIPW